MALCDMINSNRAVYQLLQKWEIRAFSKEKEKLNENEYYIIYYFKDKVTLEYYLLTKAWDNESMKHVLWVLKFVKVLEKVVISWGKNSRDIL